jgi:hypothetical protein
VAGSRAGGGGGGRAGGDRGRGLGDTCQLLAHPGEQLIGKGGGVGQESELLGIVDGGAHLQELTWVDY